MEDLHRREVIEEMKLRKHGKGPGKPGIALDGVNSPLVIADQKVYAQDSPVSQP
jgi:hypothetical protein